MLDNGITLVNERLEFLGYSSSQLRSGSIWFVNCDGLRPTPEKMIHSVGNFSCISNPATVSARLGNPHSRPGLANNTAIIPSIMPAGQCFTDAQCVLNLYNDEYVVWDDVTCDRFLGHREKEQFNFTDGVGFCCLDLKAVKIELELPCVLSAIQVVLLLSFFFIKNRDTCSNAHLVMWVVSLYYEDTF